MPGLCPYPPGVGFGMIYLPAVIAAGFYFDRRRALATGIAVCGSGIGTFVMAPLVSSLTETYGWRGAMMIQAGELQWKASASVSLYVGAFCTWSDEPAIPPGYMCILKSLALIGCPLPTPSLNRAPDR